MARFKGRFVRGGSSDYADDKEMNSEDKIEKIEPMGESVDNVGGYQIDSGVHILAIVTVIAVIIIFIVIPEYSYKITRRLRTADIDSDRYVLISNRFIRLDTQLKKINRITGDRSTIKSQDASQDDIVLAPGRTINGEYDIMVQGDAVPVHVELLDVVRWLSQSDCVARSEELGYLIAQ